ncbi:MAG: M48 family metallopeptidase [Thermodesulfobacteriota bacterium]
MRYSPSLPEDNNNITHTNPLKEFFILLAGAAILLLAVYAVLGFLVDGVVDRLSPEKELKLFSYIPTATFGVDAEKNDDPRLARLQQLTDSLGQCAGVDIPIRLHISPDRTANAVALPGGHIVFFKGLLDKLTTENGLSFTLAHELAHFHNRDHLRGLGRGIVLMAIAAAFTGPDSGLVRLVAPTAQLGQAQYSQDRETLADQSALATLNCYYGHVGGADELFQIILRDQKEGLPLTHYFSTHPQAENRISELKQSAKSNGWHEDHPVPLSF